MSSKSILSLDQIMQQSHALRLEFSSNTSHSPYAAKINAILLEFDDFAANYKILWDELSLKISESPLTGSTSQPINSRLTDLWRALKAIVTQYKDASKQPKVEAGMKFLDDLCKSNPDLFPTTQPAPDVLIFIKEKNINEDGVNIARKYPYTNTFFIGISESAVNLANNPSVEADWKPIAHELGHYIYWNSCFKTKATPNFAELDEEPVFSQDIEQALQDGLSIADEFESRALAALMVSWSEEIFADLVGTHLIGREYAVSAQKLFKREPDGASYTDDIEHPIPYLRPYVCAEGLKLIEEKENRIWFGFKSAIENMLLMNNIEIPRELLVALFSSSDENTSAFEEVSLQIPRIQAGIKIVVPLIYDLLQTREPRTDQQVGIKLIKSRMEDAFLDSYVDISDVLEKGDGPGFLRKVRKLAKRIIRIRRRGG